jgi:hypothetical protein
MSAHEDFSRSGPAVQRSSDRVFGFVMGGFFVLAGVWPLVHGRPIRTWMAAVGAVFVIAALIRPPLLRPLNQAWTMLAVLLHRVVSPVVLGALFFLVVTPIAVVMRWCQRDALRLRADPSAASYWIPRDPPGPAPESMLHPF